MQFVKKLSTSNFDVNLTISLYYNEIRQTKRHGNITDSKKYTDLQAKIQQLQNITIQCETQVPPIEEFRDLKIPWEKDFYEKRIFRENRQDDILVKNLKCNNSFSAFYICVTTGLRDLFDGIQAASSGIVALAENSLHPDIITNLSST